MSRSISKIFSWQTWTAELQKNKMKFIKDHVWKFKNNSMNIQ